MAKGAVRAQAKAAGEACPPLPPVMFRVGVTGHRPNRLEADTAELEAELRRVLTAIRERVIREAGDGARLRLLTSLAEGVDRMAARQALSLGYTLQVPLPFPQAEYEKDFVTEESIAEFRVLLAQAEVVFALETAQQHRDFAYRAAGHIVLQQSDLLLAVWDGEPGRGVGGTPELIDVAEATGRPILCMEAAAPYGLSSGGEQDALQVALGYVGERMAAQRSMTEASSASYTRERWPKRISTTSYSLLRLLGERRLTLAAAPVQSGAVPEIDNEVLKPYFRWADALAIQYGERSRSAAVRMQLLALLAVISAILILPFEENRPVMQALSFAELLSIAWLLVEVARSSRNDWHARWLLYRSLAEKIRCLDFLAPLGETIAPPERMGFAARGSRSEPEFGAELLAGVVRELGLVPGLTNTQFCEERAAALKRVVEEQATFQHKVAHRYEAVEGLLHWTGVTLFAVAVLLSVLDVLRAVAPEAFARLSGAGFSGVRVATAAAILPALGAALAGLAAQGEYKRLATRAEAMSQTLMELLREFERRRVSNLQALQSFATQIAEVLTSEVQDWQVLVAAKPPSLPT